MFTVLKPLCYLKSNVMLNIGSNVIQPNPTVNLTANNQVVAHFGGIYLKVSSDSAILESRVFTIANGISEGQTIILEFIGSNAARLAGTDKHLKSGDILSLVWNGTEWKLIESYVKIKKGAHDILLFDEMLSTVAAFGFSTTTTGAGALGNYQAPNSANLPYVTGRVGYRRSQTGTTATGRHSLTTTINTLFYFETTPIFYEAHHWIEVLPTTLQDYILTSGYLDANTNATIVDGAFFRFRQASPNWIAVTRNNSIETAVDTGIPVTAFTAWAKLKIEGTSTGVKFYVNDNLAATITTNIPSNGTRAFGTGYNFEKIIGTTNITMDTDFVRVYKELNR